MTEAVCTVQLQIVTYNSASVIRECLIHVFDQSRVPDRVIVIDNGSSDRTVEIVEGLSLPVEVIENTANQGYAAAHNQGFETALQDEYDYVLTLNPDVRLTAEYVAHILRTASQVNERIGGYTGLLLRSPDARGDQYIDSTGIEPGHFYHARDRGQGETPLRRSYDSHVWGICGAAAVYTHDLLKDLQAQGEMFDETFFLYKEDVELCYRAHRMGYGFHYVSDAVAIHDRGWKPGQRRTGEAAARSFANQIAVLLTYGERRSLEYGMAVIIEALRWLLMCIRDVRMALAAARFIRSHWRHSLDKRKYWHARALDLPEGMRGTAV